jgi:hypothetical protein
VSAAVPTAMLFHIRVKSQLIGEKRAMADLSCESRSIVKSLSCLVFVLAIWPDLSAHAQQSALPYGRGAVTEETFRRFHSDRAEMAKTGKPFKIKGSCQSACTLFLKLKNVCFDPNAQLYFHAGGTPLATQVMLNSYNGKLRSFLTANHYMDTSQFHAISGHEMIETFGYRRCAGT